MSRRRRSVGRQLAWVSLGRLLAAGLQALAIVLAARALPVSDFGLLMAFFGVITIVQAGADLGVGTFISKERAAHGDSGGVSSALRFTSLSSTAVVVVVALGLVAAATVLSPVFWSMLPLAVSAAGERNADMRLAVAFADGDVHVSVLNLLARRSAVVALFLAALAAQVAPVLGFCLASAVAAGGSATFANLYVRGRVRVAPTLTTRALLRRARPFWVESLASQARNLDTVLVAALAGPGQAGVYSSGSRLVNPLQILPTSLASVLLPASARSSRSHAALRRILVGSLVVLAVLMVLYVVIFLAAPVIVRVALGARYEGAADVIRVLLVGLPFASAGALLISVLQGRDRGPAVALASMASTVVCLVGVAVVAPSGGALGAAVVLSASFAVRLVALVPPLLSAWSEPDPDPVAGGGGSPG